MSESPSKSELRRIESVLRTMDVLNACVVLTKRRGYAPTLREIARETGIPSTSVVSYHLDRLEDAGNISRDAMIPRSIRVLRSAEGEE